MHVSLTPELEKVVREKVASGHYSNSSEVIREALRLMIEQTAGLNWLRKEAAAGFEQLNDGQFVELNHQEFLQRLKPKRRAA